MSDDYKALYDALKAKMELLQSVLASTRLVAEDYRASYYLAADKLETVRREAFEKTKEACIDELQKENERLKEALKSMKRCFAVIDCEDCTAVIARALEEPTE